MLWFGHLAFGYLVMKGIPEILPAAFSPKAVREMGERDMIL